MTKPYKSIMTRIIQIIASYVTVLLAFTTSWTAFALQAHAQSQITLSSTATELYPGQSGTAELAISPATDLYFIAFDLYYDATKVQVDSSSFKATDLFENGLQYFNILEPGHAVASLSRTSVPQEPEEGIFGTFEFTTKNDASAGFYHFMLEEIEAVDSKDSPLSVTYEPSHNVEVLESYAEISFDFFPSNPFLSTNEGTPLWDTLRVSIGGVASNDTSAIRATTVEWAALPNHMYAPPLDLGQIPENEWSSLEFDHIDDKGLWVYPINLSWKLEEGDYFIVTRATKPSGETFYGDLMGMVDDPAFVYDFGTVAIYPYEFHQYTVAKWTFEDRDLVVDEAIFPNQGKRLELVGTTLAGFVQGHGDGSAVSARSWHFEPGLEGQKGWEVLLETGGLRELRVSSKHTSSGSGPKELHLIGYDIDGNIFDVGGKVITLDDSNYELGSYRDVEIPQGAPIGETLHLAWQSPFDERQDGTGPISSAGTSKIDDIVITGYHPNPTMIYPRPGDTNNDGVVSIQDVLPLGIHWYKTGPKPVHNITAFEPRKVEQWIDEAAVYADTDGNGIINHLDLKYIGLHFGKSTEPSPSPTPLQGSSETPSDTQVRMPALPVDHWEYGKQFTVGLENTQRDIAGVAYSLSLPNHWQEFMKIEALPTMSDGASALEDDRLLSMRLQTDSTLHVAHVVKQPTMSQTPDLMARLVIEPLKDLPEGMSIKLNELSIVTHNGHMEEVSNPNDWLVLATTTLETTQNEYDHAVPEKTSLLPAYPNPFNPEATIQFTLRSGGHTSLRVYNIVGQEVMTLLDKRLGMGRHEIQFNAGEASLATGIYFIQLEHQGERFTQQVTLMK